MDREIKAQSFNDIKTQKNLCFTLIGDCFSKREIIDLLISTYNLSESVAFKRYKEALAEYVNSEEFEEFRKVNIGRLDKIVKRAYEDKKYGEAIKAIDVQNKMIGGYVPEKVEVSVNQAIF